MTTEELLKAAEYVRDNDNCEYSCQSGGLADADFTRHAKALAAHVLQNTAATYAHEVYRVPDSPQPANYGWLQVARPEDLHGYAP
jgi:hypothetical protein